MKKSILLVPAICYTMIAGGVKPFNGRYILVKNGKPLHVVWDLQCVYEALSAVTLSISGKWVIVNSLKFPLTYRSRIKQSTTQK